MRRKTQISVIALVFVVAWLSAYGEEPLPAAEGIAYVTPIQNGSCIAVKVPVAENQAISGFQWFNGADDLEFSMAMVASGAGDFPPPLPEAVGLAADLPGQRAAWSEVTFNEPIASESSSLFLIMQYPDGYASPDSGLEMGVGYITGEGQGCYFVSSDGDSWIKVASRCQLLVEPVFCVRDSSMLSKSMQPEEDTPSIPKEFSVKSYPNPFNPVTTIEVGLPKATDCSIKIYDIRGRMVKNLYMGREEAGIAKFTWDGTDGRGQTTGSGVYFAVVKTEEKAFNQRLVLIK
ncbi:MAG: FlgD immunoglobulin-like domain containing protein [Candidatus Krumholzibacteriia bacterium]